MKIKLDKDAIKPTRAHAQDAGLDLYTPEDVIIGPQAYKVINTGVHVELPAGTYGRVASKSGLMTKAGIITDGTVDEGYTGPICVCLFNTSLIPKRFEKGDKIAQLVIMPCVKPELEFVDSLDDTERGSDGFGSTGR